MEYIHGVDLTEHTRRHDPSPSDRLGLLAKICDAVHHAHQKGVIHRDLKPANILIDSTGQPKILDFGVARATDSDLQLTTQQTDVGQIIGTLQYMSPEQIAASPDDLDTRSDVYALGVISYELLAGSPPYNLKDRMIHEVARVIREEEPTRLSAVSKIFRGDIETIVAKALEKDKDRRYQSAAELAADIRRYLQDEPIVARPSSATYQLRKFARRNRALVGGILGIFIALVAGVILTSWQYFIAEAERANAAERADELEQVTAFQEGQLAGIDVPRMGEGLKKGIIKRARDAAEWEQLSEEEIEARAASLEQALAGADFTNLALETLDIHIFQRARAAVEEQFPDQPVIRARLLQTLADTLRELGLVEQATDPQKKALALRRERLGNDDEDTIYSINSMGRLLSAQGKLAEAEAYYRETMERAQATKGDDFIGTMTAMDNLAAMLRQQGKLDEAETLLRVAFERRRRALGPQDPDTLVSMNNLGLLLQEFGRFEEAERLHREALEVRTKIFGADHPETLVSVNNLGFVLYRLGRHNEAEQYYRRALEARRRVLGNDHPETILSINNLGSALMAQGKLPEAAQYHREAMETSRRVLGDEHHRTVLWANNYGAILNRLERYDDSVRVLRELEPAARQVWVGEKDPWLGNYLAKLGEGFGGLGRFRDGEQVLLEAYSRVIAGGEQHRMTIGVVQRLVTLYEAWHAAEPDGDYENKAAEWRAKLPESESANESSPPTGD